MPKEISKRLVEIDGGLLQRNGVKIAKPTVSAAALGSDKKRLQVVLGGQPVALNSVTMHLDR
jgi:hypothetical protein